MNIQFKKHIDIQRSQFIKCWNLFFHAFAFRVNNVLKYVTL